METSFSALNPTAGHRQSRPLPETLGHSWASLGKSLVESLLLSSGSWCTQGLFDFSECLAGMAFDYKLDFCPSYHLAGASPLSLDMG